MIHEDSILSSQVKREALRTCTKWKFFYGKEGGAMMLLAKKRKKKYFREGQTVSLRGKIRRSQADYHIFYWGGRDREDPCDRLLH